jgi:predicted transcriptional regulator
MEYMADYLDQVHVADIASQSVVSLRTSQSLAEVRHWLDTDQQQSRHQGYPVLDERGVLTGVVTRRDILACDHGGETPLAELIRRPPVYVYDTSTARDAADHMVRHDVGRLPVVSRNDPKRLIGIVTRSDILSVYQRRLRESTPVHPRDHWQDRKPPLTSSHT